MWRTEYNYPSWGSGYPLPELANGAVHGMYWASNVLSAISYTLATNYSRVKFPVVMLHLMIDQIGVGWGARSGIVRVAGAGDVDAMRVNGLAQIFAHLPVFLVPVWFGPSPIQGLRNNYNSWISSNRVSDGCAL